MPAFSPSAVATAATAVGVADMGAAAAGAGAVLAGGAGTLAGGAEAGALATGAFSSDLPQPVRITTNAKPVSIVSIQSCVRITPSLPLRIRLLVYQLNFDQETASWRDLDVLTPHPHGGA